MFILNASGITHTCVEKPIKGLNTINGFGETEIEEYDHVLNTYIKKKVIGTFSYPNIKDFHVFSLTDEKGKSVEFANEQIDNSYEDAIFELADLVAAQEEAIFELAMRLEGK